MCLRRICILLLLDDVSCKCHLNPIDWWCCSAQLCPHWVFSICWLLTECCWLPMSVLICFWRSFFCLMCLDLLSRGIYTLKIFESSWRTDTFIPNASLIILLVLKFTLFECHLIISAHLFFIDKHQWCWQFTFPRIQRHFFQACTYSRLAVL